MLQQRITGQHIIAELTTLRFAADQLYPQIYAQGVQDALKWIMQLGPAPSTTIGRYIQPQQKLH